MKKIWGWIVGVVIVVALVFYIIWNATSSTPVATNTNTNPDDGNSSTTGGMTGMNMSSTASGTMVMPAGSGYKDGTYTGSVADAVYGKLQLSVTISGGMITNITWPVYPNTAGHTSQVSATALPALEQEAIASQSASVNVVSGATQDSQAFQQSLASALAQAQA